MPRPTITPRDRERQKAITAKLKRFAATNHTDLAHMREAQNLLAVINRNE